MSQIVPQCSLFELDRRVKHFWRTFHCSTLPAEFRVFRLEGTAACVRGRRWEVCWCALWGFVHSTARFSKLRAGPPGEAFPQTFLMSMRNSSPTSLYQWAPVEFHHGPLHKASSLCHFMHLYIPYGWWVLQGKDQPWHTHHCTLSA